MKRLNERRRRAAIAIAGFAPLAVAVAVGTIGSLGAGSDTPGIGTGPPRLQRHSDVEEVACWIPGTTSSPSAAYRSGKSRHSSPVAMGAAHWLRSWASHSF